MAAAVAGPSTALEQLNEREHAPGGAGVEGGGDRVAAAGHLLQEQARRSAGDVRTEHVKYLNRF